MFCFSQSESLLVFFRQTPGGLSLAFYCGSGQMVDLLEVSLLSTEQCRSSARFTIQLLVTLWLIPSDYSDWPGGRSAWGRVLMVPNIFFPNTMCIFMFFCLQLTSGTCPVSKLPKARSLWPCLKLHRLWSHFAPCRKCDP